MVVVWIRKDVVLAVHRRQIAEHGGVDGVRDSGLLESALSKPENLFHYENPRPDIALLAASYAYGVVRNHPFIDGNKRTALVVCMLFLKLNGVELIASGEEKYQIFMELAAGGLTEKSLSEWIRAHQI
jgi:death-on-curing protein